MIFNDSDLHYFQTLLRENKKFLISSHQSLDTDAVASEYALHRFLEILGKDVVTINEKAPSPLIEPFPLGSSSFFSLEDRELPADCRERIFFVVDSAPERSGEVWKRVRDQVKETFIIDHHEYDRPPSPSLIVPEAGSCSEIIAALLRLSDVKPDPRTAEALYAGIVTDTGFFSYPKTHASTLKEAARLLECGAESNRIYKRFYQQFSLSGFFMRQDVLKKIEFHFHNRVAFLSWNTKKLLKHGVSPEDLQDIVNIPLAYKEIELSVLFKQKEDKTVTGSLRSKGKINCSDLAKHWQGGGHKTAAGFRSTRSLASLKKGMLRFLRDAF